MALLFLAAARYRWGRLTTGAALVSLAEAGALAMLAALWFGSLGTGGWVTVFALLGALAGSQERAARHALTGSGTRADLGYFLLDIARYLGAGALLAWRLG